MSVCGLPGMRARHPCSADSLASMYQLLQRVPPQPAQSEPHTTTSSSSELPQTTTSSSLLPQTTTSSSLEPVASSLVVVTALPPPAIVQAVWQSAPPHVLPHTTLRDAPGPH